MFARFDLNKAGEINYSEFLAATVNKKTVLTKANLRFAFHHFDTDNEGYITKNDLKEVFKRSGQRLTDNDLDLIIKQAKEVDDDDFYNDDESDTNYINLTNLNKKEEEKTPSDGNSDKLTVPKPPKIVLGSRSPLKNLNPDDCISFEEFEKLMKQII